MRDEDVNNARGNIIELLLRLYKKLENNGKEVHLYLEHFQLHYTSRGLSVEGCTDRVFVKDYRYASVSLGDKIKSYRDVPYSWLKQLAGK